MHQTLIYEKIGKSTIPYTTVMQVRTKDIIIERTMLYAWMISGMDDSTLKLPSLSSETSSTRKVDSKPETFIMCQPKVEDGRCDMTGCLGVG